MLFRSKRKTESKSKMAQKLFAFSTLQRQLCANRSLSELLKKHLSSSAHSTVGVIGLGNMGGHMAKNLLKKVRKIN